MSRLSWPSVGMPLHLGVLGVGQMAGLVQDGVGDADLADVVERRQGGDQVDPLGRQDPPVRRMRRQARGQQPDVFLGAAGVPAGVDVAGLGQCGQRLDDQLLGLVAAAVLGVGAAALGGQLRAHRDRRRRWRARTVAPTGETTMPVAA